MKQLFLMGFLCLFVKVAFSQKQDSIKEYTLGEVTVSASLMDAKLKDMPQKVEIIDKAVIKSVPSENLAELLKRTTNLDIIQYPGMSANIGMRGFSPSAQSRSYTLLLINGKPSGATNFASINTENIERIEIVKGPYSMLYGSDAMGGVVNIITKTATEESKGNVSIAAGSYGNMKLSGDVSGALTKKANFILGFSRQEQQDNYRIGASNFLKLSEKEKLMLDKESYGDVMKNTAFQVNNVNGQLNYSINEKWSSGLEMLYSSANDVGTPGNYWGSYGQSKKDIQRINLFNNIRRVSKKNLFSVSPYYNKENVSNYSDISDSTYVDYKSKVEEYGFKMNDNILFGDFKLLLGADLDVYACKSERFSDKTTPINPYNPNNSNTKAALYSQLVYSKNNLYVNGGVRYDNVFYNISKNDSLKGTGGKTSYRTFNPSFGIQYTLLKTLKLHGSAGTAFSVPDAFKMAGYFKGFQNFKGNPDLKPESSITYDFGANYALLNSLFNIDLTYFQTYHKNKIIQYTIPGNKGVKGSDTTSFKNANKSNMNGLELMASVNFGSLFNNKFKLELYVNSTYMLTSKVDEALKAKSGVDSVVTREMLYVRKNNSNFGVFFDNNKGFSTRLHARYIGSRYEKDNFAKLRPGITTDNYYSENGYTVKDKVLGHADYLVLDYSIYYTIQKNKRFGVTVSNLLDENYTEKDGYNMPGRMIIGSFSYSF